MRRLPPPLRMWSGVLLVCALLLCLAGIARPAMAMPEPMPGMAMGMDMGSASTSGPGPDAAHVLRATTSGSADHGTHCPMATQQCASRQATPAPDSPAAPPLAESPRGESCLAVAVVTLPNAPPSIPPPDLNRLCVSRT